MSPRFPRLSFAFALALAACSAAAAERVTVRSPWTAGETLVYDTESLTREREDGADAVRRTTDRTEIRAEATDDGGMLLTWTTRDSRVETVEGDRAMADLIAPLLDSFDGHPIAIELDRDGRYRRVRELDAVAERLRAAMLPIFIANVERSLAPAGAQAQGDEHEAMLDRLRKRIEADIDSLVSLASVETAASGQARTLGGFVGKHLAPGRRYRDQEPMRSRVEGVPLPAKREYVLSLDRDDPNLARIRWTHTLDAEGEPAALWRLADELGGGGDGEARSGRPQNLALSEEGMLLFRRDTGRIELVETVLVSRYGKAHDERERHRMRLRGGARSWAQEEAARER